MQTEADTLEQTPQENSPTVAKGLLRTITEVLIVCIPVWIGLNVLSKLTARPFFPSTWSIYPAAAESNANAVIFSGGFIAICFFVTATEGRFRPAMTLGRVLLCVLALGFATALFRNETVLERVLQKQAKYSLDPTGYKLETSQGTYHFTAGMLLPLAERLENLQTPAPNDL